MEGNKESILAGYPNVISYECTQKIMEQMEKNVCKIEIGEEQGTGFFTKIPFPDKNNLLSVFITNNHILNEKVLYSTQQILFHIKYINSKIKNSNGYITKNEKKIITKRILKIYKKKYYSLYKLFII